MLPGLGVGGYCLTKDPLLASWSKQNNLPLVKYENAVTTNDKIPRYAYELLEFFDEENPYKEVYLLGVSYAPDVGDTRYSPVELFKLLNKENCVIHLNDPYVNFWKS